MANVCCSIEMEPRTLNQGQINHAREMAADVAQKKEQREASSIFIEGLISAVQSKELQQSTDEGKEEIGAEKRQCNPKAEILEKPCQCSYSNMESPPHPNNVKEPVTAPF